MLAQAILKELLYYDPETGIFTNRINRANNLIKAGTLAGDINNGYHRIKINNKNYRSNRLAFLYMEGYLPENPIDHEDRNKLNNKWDNLREVSNQCNSRNKGLSNNNTSKITGVTWSTRDSKWIAQIKVNKKQYRLGQSVNKTEAVILRWKAEIKHNWPNCNSASPAYLYLKERDLT